MVNLLDQKLWNQNPDFLSYTLSKAALEAAGTMLALALAPRVRVVGVAPGLTLTSHLLSEEQFRQRQWPGRCGFAGRSLNCRVFGSRPALSPTCPPLFFLPARARFW